MDVVRRNIQDMGGHVQLSCEPGNGTTTRIVLPLTLAILDGMSVRVGEETFILPLNHVTESLQPTNDQIYSVAGNERVMHVRGEYLPLVEMHRVFSVSDAQTDPTQAIAVIMQAEDRRFALLVDHLIGQHRGGQESRVELPQGPRHFRRHHPGRWQRGADRRRICACARQP